MVRLVAVGAVGVLAVSCAPLTKSQVRAVHEFASVAAHTTALPPEVLAGLNEVHEERVVVLGSTLNVGRGTAEAPTGNADLAFAKLEHEVAFARSMKALSTRLAKTIAVLDVYVECLGALSVDEFNGDLTEATSSLAGSLDRAVASYNKAVPEHALPAVGTLASQAVRAAGGVCIATKQASALKAFTSAADPVVQRLAADLKTFLQSVGDDYLARECDDLKSDFAAFGATHGPFLALNDTAAIVDALRGVDELTQRIDATVGAVQSFGKAHAALTKTLAKPAELADRIEEVQVLIEQVQAAASVSPK